jgi:hypothetical protein
LFATACYLQGDYTTYAAIVSLRSSSSNTYIPFTSPSHLEAILKTQHNECWQGKQHIPDKGARTMTRIGRIWIQGLTVLLVALAVVMAAGAGVAQAQTATGTGTLHAYGYGSVHLSGSGTITIQEGAGTVWVDSADSIEADGRGRRVELPNGAIRLTGYSGTVQITGEDMRVRIVGGVIDLTASGSGSVWLNGEGTYETANSSGVWEVPAIKVEF